MSFQVLEIPQIVSLASRKVRITKKYHCKVVGDIVYRLRETISLPRDLIELIMSFFHPHILPITPTKSIFELNQNIDYYSPTLLSLGLLKWAHSWLNEYASCIEDCERSRTKVNITKIDIGDDLSIFKHSGITPMKDYKNKTIRWVKFTHYSTKKHLDDCDIKSLYWNKDKFGPKFTKVRAQILLLNLEFS